MKLWKTMGLAGALALATMAHAPSAEACGGCFVSQSESTQVTGHQMILSIAPDATTLWDQITYSGDPADFAWVLPIKGIAEIGLSSDIVFQVLDQQSKVSVLSPVITCPQPPSCGDFDGLSTGPGPGTGAGGNSGEPPVKVIAQEVVGPFATVQLESSDPEALNKWLDDNGYKVPADVVKVINAYVAEKFNFLALKLVPGQGVSAMRPVRVTTKGASPVLPLRMVAAGTGAITGVTLWVLGEGRYEPQNFPSFEIKGEDLVWNWDTQSSNYAALKDAGFKATGNTAWLVESGEALSNWQLEDPILTTVQYSPDESGYTEEKGNTLKEQAEADIADLIGEIDPTALTLSRVSGQLSRQALVTDLKLQAAADQTPVVRTFECDKTTGTPPACPTFEPCEETSTGAGVGPGDDDGNNADDFEDVWGGGNKGSSGEGCSLGGSGAVPLFALGALFLATARARRRGRKPSRQ